MRPLRRSKSDAGNRSKLYLDPAELAQKLIKELESDKVSRGPRVSVRNRYTVYLCREDHLRLSPQADRLVEKLEAHLSKYVQAKRYEVPGPITVSLTADPDLDLGHFGIFGERELSPDVVRADRATAPTRAAVPTGARSSSRAAAPTRAGSSTRAAAPTRTSTNGGPALPGPAKAVRPASAPAAPAKSQQPRSHAFGPEAVEKADGSTQVISAAEAVEAGLARQTIVLTVDGEKHVFNQGRVIVGRSRDVDFRIDSAEVSRRHAAFYWSDGSIMVKDLGSTNGTMVNGYPVDSTIVRPGDVVLVGDCAIRAEAR